MSSAGVSGRYTLGIPHEVPLDQVETILRGLWEEAEKTAEGDLAPVLQVRTLNLVVHLSGPEDLARVRSPLAEISAAHPGRVMILCPEPDAPEETISAQATIYCYLQRPGRQKVCGEEITLFARGQAVSELHTAVLSLRLSDLPVILWWISEPPLDEPRFAALARAADRVILDSAAYSRPLVQLQRCAALFRERQRELALSDLNWTRLTPWRELVAQFYDDREALSYLYQLNEVTIEYDVYDAEEPAGNPGLLQGLLLAAWLGSRLAWQPAGAAARHDQGWALTLAANSGEVRVALLPVGKAASPGLCSVRLAGGGAEFSIACDKASQVMTVSVRLPCREPIKSMTRLSKEDVPDLMRKELMIAGHERVFEAALLLADQLAAMMAP